VSENREHRLHRFAVLKAKIFTARAIVSDETLPEDLREKAKRVAENGEKIWKKIN